jgi:methylated-DNA-[protein]-cysteine S-methyltransferase
MADRKENYHAIVASPCGMLGIVADSAVRCIDFLHPRVAAQTATTPLARATVRQLAAYFRNPTWQFDLPLALAGTDHQRRVWRVLQTIPVGEVVYYGDVARRLRSGARAVGGACGANPVPIIVPCHRVVARNGLGGFTGGRVPHATDIKQWLLRHEGA